MNNDGLQMFSEIFLFFFFFGLYGSLSASNIFPVGGKRIRASEFSLRKKSKALRKIQKQLWRDFQIRNYKLLYLFCWMYMLFIIYNDCD